MKAIATRRALVEDAALLARLHAQCFDEAWDEAAFSTFLRDPLTFALVVEGIRETRAFILVRVVVDECEILSLGTLPHARRSGYARTLVVRGCAEAFRRGACRAHLEVAADNEAALSLYKKAGFIPTGCRPSYYPRAAGKTADAMILSAALPL
jgi:[ribosomal protein S18]-alanine N-acetyltransferase